MSGKATVHGVYDYWLGGGMHERPDRELGKAIEEEFPTVRPHVWAAKEFHLRVARWSAERGIARFVRAGAVTWAPNGRNIHEAAREVIPAAEVVYVNRDAEAADWAREQLADGPGLASVRASVFRPAEVLGAPEVAALLAPRRPVCLIIGMVMHFAPAERAAAMTAAYVRALPSGSVIAVSVALPDNSPQADRLLVMFTPAKVCRHTAADVAGWLGGAGLEIIPPGVRDVRLVPGWDEAEPHPRAPGYTVGALGRVP